VAALCRENTDYLADANSGGHEPSSAVAVLHKPSITPCCEGVNTIAGQCNDLQVATMAMLKGIIHCSAQLEYSPTCPSVMNEANWYRKCCPGGLCDDGPPNSCSEECATSFLPYYVDCTNSLTWDLQSQSNVFAARCVKALQTDGCGVINGDGATCADVCGVPNGAGNSCKDKCGVPNGDDSSCKDKCGVPNGDSTSCDSCFIEGKTGFSPMGCGHYGSCFSYDQVGKGFCRGGGDGTAKVNGIRHDGVSSQASCQSICSAINTCVGYSYAPTSHDGRCYVHGPDVIHKGGKGNHFADWDQYDGGDDTTLITASSLSDSTSESSTVCMTRKSEGVCICDKGYTGSNCDVQSDKCAGVDCGENGVCANGACVCETQDGVENGFSGKNCEVSPDLCTWPQVLSCGEHATIMPRHHAISILSHHV
jgi:hypothetical protein